MAISESRFTSCCGLVKWIEYSAKDEPSDDDYTVRTVVRVDSYDDSRKTLDTYGKLSGASDSQIRKRQGLLFLGNITLILPAIRAIYRITHILSGEWAWGMGYRDGLRKWHEGRIQAANGVNPSQQAPGRLGLYTRVALCSLARLGECLLKLATLPIASLSVVVGACVAMVDPHLGRAWHGFTEELWSIDTKTLAFQKDQGILSFWGPCMLPIRVFDRFHLYPITPWDIRCQILIFQNQLKEFSAYFTADQAARLTAAADAADSYFHKSLRKSQFILDRNFEDFISYSRGYDSKNRFIDKRKEIECLSMSTEEEVSKLKEKIKELSEIVKADLVKYQKYQGVNDDMFLELKGAIMDCSDNPNSRSLDKIRQFDWNRFDSSKGSSYKKSFDEKWSEIESLLPNGNKKALTEKFEDLVSIVENMNTKINEDAKSNQKELSLLIDKINYFNTYVNKYVTPKHWATELVFDWNRLFSLKEEEADKVIAGLDKTNDFDDLYNKIINSAVHFKS